eukprot:301960_1
MGNVLFTEDKNNGPFSSYWKSMFSPNQADGRSLRRLSALNSNVPSAGLQRQRHQQIFVKSQIITVDNHFLEVGELLGCGGFADVYDCRPAFMDKEQHLTTQTLYLAKKRLQSNDNDQSIPKTTCMENLCFLITSADIIELVAKVERNDNIEFDNEHRILQHLSELNADFMPPVLCMGLFDEHRIIVMQRLSMDCETLLKSEFGGRMSPCMASEMVCAMLYCLESLHACGYIHNDIKPENFLLNNTGKIYLIDFGLATKYLDFATNEHIEYAKSKSLKGTLRYASINIHKGILSSRRDDIESIFYVWLYFMLGRLPWQNIHTPHMADKKSATYKRWKNVLKVKQNCKIDNVCRDFEPGMIGLIEQFRNHFLKLEFDEKPDYQLLYRILRRIIV